MPKFINFSKFTHEGLTHGQQPGLLPFSQSVSQSPFSEYLLRTIMVLDILAHKKIKLSSLKRLNMYTNIKLKKHKKSTNEIPGSRFQIWGPISGFLQVGAFIFTIPNLFHFPALDRKVLPSSSLLHLCPTTETLPSCDPRQCSANFCTWSDHIVGPVVHNYFPLWLKAEVAIDNT